MTDQSLARKHALLARLSDRELVATARQFHTKPDVTRAEIVTAGWMVDELLRRHDARVDWERYCDDLDTMNEIDAFTAQITV